MSTTTFQGAVHQNKFLADGAAEVSAVVEIKSVLPVAATAVRGNGRVIGFAVDRSGSMDGEKWRSARTALAEAIGLLPEDAEFFVILGNESAQTLIPLQKATAANKQSAIALVRQQDSGGNTYFGQWLTAATAIFRQRPQAIKVLVFLTDGENNDEDTSRRLPGALREATGLYQVECRGVGSSYRPEQLRTIVGALGGSIDGMQNAGDLAKDFAAIVEKTKGLSMASVQLQLWTPVGARVKMVKQVAPEILDLTGKLTPGSNPRIQRIDTGAWGEESRDYHVIVELEANAIGKVGGPEKLCARVSLVYSDNGTETEIKLNEGGQIKAEWTDDEKRSAVINPKVANYTGQAELASKIQEGVQALNAGDEEKATKALARAAELAEATGNEEATKRLKKFIETDDKGTKRLKKNISEGDKVDLDTKSTKTRRVK
jgi:Mg-chelatase subunit ChlD